MAEDSPMSNGTSDTLVNDANGEQQPRQLSRENSPARSGEDKSIKRRAHRKSRFGCKNCKVRRIKCDEKKPECTNCRNRQVRCDYLPVATPTSRTLSNDSPISSTEKPTSSNEINVHDAELMYYWTTTTCESLSVQRPGATFWRTNVTEIGLAHPYVLHLVYCVTALHIALNRPSRREEYLSLADHHYSAALPSVTAELLHMNQDNCDAILISVQLVCFVTWARGPKPGEYLAFGENGRSEWLIMFRGIRTTLESMSYGSFTRSHAPQIRAIGRPLPKTDTPLAYEEPLSELRDYVNFASKPPMLESNRYAFDILLECYKNRYGGVDGEYHIVFAWLYKMKDDFLEALQKHDPVPLVLFAHFAVLMNDLETFWYMRGWTAHVLSGIWDILRDEDRVHARWPISVVGWIPP